MLIFLTALYAQEPTNEADEGSTTQEANDGSDESQQYENSSTEDADENGSSIKKEQSEQAEEITQEGQAPESAEEKDSSNEESDFQLPNNDGASEVIDTKNISQEEPNRKNGVVTLKNGDTIHGSVLDSGNGIHVDVGGEEDLYVPESSILTLSYPKGNFTHPDLGHTRYFYAPTAMPMKSKSGYLSQKELLFSTVAYSPVQDVSLLVGTSVPLALLYIADEDSDYLLGLAGIRYGTKVADKWYVGGGIESLFAFSDTISLPFVNATYGDAEQHITIGGGVVVNSFDWKNIDNIPVYLSAYKRISSSVALLTENWFIGSPSYDWKEVIIPDCVPESDDDCYQSEKQYNWSQFDSKFIAASIGIRFISKKFTTDLGLINIFSSSDYIPIPWLDVTWYFGQDVQ